MEARAPQEHEEILYWEGIALKTMYGKYISEIEKRAILKAHSLAANLSTALEIGSEGGRWSKLLSEFGWRLICTDISQRSLDLCQAKIPMATCMLVSSDDSQLPCDTEGIGLVLCIEVAPVIHADWFIDEAYRVLQKGGWIVGAFWNHLSWRGLVHDSILASRTRASSNQHWYPLSYPVWRKSFCKRGFSLVHEEGYAWLPFRRASNSHLVPVAARIEHYLGLCKLVSLSPMIVFIAQKD